MSALADLLSLTGERALVSGGCGGIGSAVCRLLAAAGAEVTAIDLPGREPPPGVAALGCDLADEDAIAALAPQLAGDPPYTVFVHCAGITDDGVLWKLPPASWHRVLRVNLDSAFHLLRLLIPGMRAAGRGRVVLTASINGERGKFGQANYAASKAGLIGLGKTAARELGRFGIRVNVVSPGLIETRMTERLPEQFRREAVVEAALSCMGRPDDVARTVVYLCTELSSHVTGQVIRVDGGQVTA